MSRDSIVILMDPWDYRPNETCKAQNLRKPACENINRVIQQLLPNLHCVINANYGGKFNHNLDVDSWKIPVRKIYTTPELFPLLKYNNIKNIWYLGFHWNRCVMNRPIGYESVINHTTQHDINIYTVENCTLELFTSKKQHGPTVERWPQFKDDPVTDLVQVNDRDWQILGKKSQADMEYYNKGSR